MDKEELKSRTVVNWRRYYSEQDALDAIVSEDATRRAEITACAIKCRTWTQALHEKIDAGDQAEVDKITAEFTYPKLEEL